MTVSVLIVGFTDSLAVQEDYVKVDEIKNEETYHVEFVPFTDEELDSFKRDNECCNEIELNENDVEILAKLIWGEARGVKTKEEKAAVVWCVLNRVDAKEFPNTIEEVVTQKYQFSGYSNNFPVDDELKEIAEDVLHRWYSEKDGEADVGRVLPKTYLYFIGDGVGNNFMEVWRSGVYWDWSLKSPYEK